MRKPNQEQIAHWMKFAKKWVLRKEEKIASGKGKQATYTSLASIYASLARSKFLNDDLIDEVNSEFSNAARSMLKNFTMAYDNADPDYQGNKADLSCVSETDFIEGINYALMAGNLELASELGQWFQDRPDGHKIDIDVNRYAHALALIVQGRSNDAIPYLKAQINTYAQKSPKSEGDKNYYTLITSLWGILNQDEGQFNQGLLEQLELYQNEAQGESKDTDEEFICDHAVALSNLGLHHGLSVTVDYPTLPQGLLIQPN